MKELAELLMNNDDLTEKDQYFTAYWVVKELVKNPFIIATCRVTGNEKLLEELPCTSELSKCAKPTEKKPLSQTKVFRDHYIKMMSNFGFLMYMREEAVNNWAKHKPGPYYTEEILASIKDLDATDPWNFMRIAFDRNPEFQNEKI